MNYRRALHECVWHADRSSRVESVRKLLGGHFPLSQKEAFTNVFHFEHGRALQFGENLKHGATHMYHLVSNLSIKQTPVQVSGSLISRDIGA